MEKNNAFIYTYSATQNREVERIRKKYLPEGESKLETLRKLDNRAQSAGMIPSLCIGIVGILLFGLGLCFGLGALAGAGWLSVFFGILGVLVMLPAYPAYQYISKKVRANLTPEILRLSDEILKNQD